jgi:predicted nucleic acid-binding protein
VGARPLTAERRVLLDTSVVIDPPAAGLASVADLAAISAITVAELEYGVDAAKDPLERQRRRRRLQAIADVMEVLAFDVDTAQSYGMMANLVRTAGRDPRPRRLDLLIAATAERHGLSLATRNPDDFRHLERVLHVVPVV